MGSPEEIYGLFAKPLSFTSRVGGEADTGSMFRKSKRTLVILRVLQNIVVSKADPAFVSPSLGGEGTVVDRL
jgi:hypothetical protein